MLVHTGLAEPSDYTQPVPGLAAQLKAKIALIYQLP